MMRQFNSPALLIGVLALALVVMGCSRRSQVGVAPTGLRQAIHIYEQRFNLDHPRAVAAGRHLAYVDYDSQIELRPQPEQLSRLAAGDLSAESTERIEKAQDMLIKTEDLMRTLLSTVADYQQSYRAYQQLQLNNPTKRLATDDDLQQAWRTIKTNERKIISTLTPLINQTIAQRYDIPDFDLADSSKTPDLTIERHDDLKKKANDLYLSMKPGRDVRADAIQRFMNELIDEQRQEVEGVVEDILEQSTNAELSIYASLQRGDQSIPLSLEPYSRVTGVNRGDKSPRVGMPNQEQQEVIENRYRAYDNLANEINRTAAQAGSSVDAFGVIRSMAERVKSQLVTWLEEAIEQRAKAIVAHVKTTGEQIENLPDSQAAKAQLKAIDNNLQSIQQDVKSIIATIRRSSQFDTLAMEQTIVSTFESTRDIFRSVEEVLDLIEQAKPVVAALGADLVANIQTEIDDLATELQDDAKDVILEAVPELKPLQEAIHFERNMVAFGGMRAVKIEHKAIPVSQARLGILSLANSPAESGDDLKIEMRVKYPDGSAPDHYSEQNLRVRKFGWYTTMAAALAFLDRQGDDSDAFSAAPLVAWNLHYRAADWGGAYDIVSPGIGVSAAVPSFEGSAEVGVGAHVTLFNNMLIGGYGWNLSVDDDQEYWYVAVDLIETFQLFGR